MYQLKVSVVTATYNNAENLKKTLDALLKQDYPSVESIIVDGGSTDGSVEIIKDFVSKFKGEVKWVSEKDKGLYDAANKGIRMATGDIIGTYWDEFATPHVLSKIVEVMEKEKTDGAHGNLVYLNGDKVIRYWRMGKGTIQEGWMPAHPTLYLRKEVYEKYGYYNTDYKCSGDYEFMVRSMKDGDTKLSYIPEILIHMFYGGVSTSGVGAYKQSIQEGIKALKENNVRWAYWITLKRTIKTSFQFVMRK